MKIISSPLELKAAVANSGKSVGFVPTMGALHEGHMTLIRKAKEENEIVVVSIFVNPTQFLKGEDLDKYPRKDEADKEICRLSGVDILFFPTADDVYGADEASVLAPKVRGFVLEGATRPSHFNGVLTVVMKLLNIVSPAKAYFGKKDAQQLLLIESMVREFFMSVKIVAVDTVRQKDGLALSSRNVYLNAQEQVEALKIPLSLRAASAVVSRGNLNAKAIKQAALEALSGLDVCYVEVLDRRLGVVETITLGDALILVEARVGNTRLLDNIWL